MSNVVGELQVRVTADTSPLAKSIEQQGQQVGKSFGSKLAVGLGAAAAGVGVAAVGITGAVLSIGKAYEDNLLKFKAVTGATTAEMDKAKEAAKALGNDLTLPGVSAGEAAEAMVELGKAGYTVDEAIKGADGTMRLAIAGQLGVAEASTITANALMAFNLEASESGRVADLLAAGANATSAEVGDMAAALAQSSAVFAAANVPIEQVTTQIGLLANAGIKGSDAGTSLKTMLMRLQSPSGEAAAMMKELGVSVYDAEGNMRDFPTIVDQFTKATAGLSEEQKANAINTIFGTDAARAANIVLTQGVDKYNQMTEAVTKVGAANEMAAATTGGLTGAIEAIKSQLETVAIGIYESVAPALTETIRAISPVIESLTPLLESLGKGFAQIAGSLGGALVSTIQSLVPALTPIIALIADLAVRLGPILEKVLGKLSQLLVALLGAVMPLLEPLTDLLITTLDAAWPIIEVVIDALLSLIDALAPLLGIVGSLLPVIGQLVNVAFAAILPILQPLLPVIDALAVVLADVLGRAIGIVITAAGYLIQAWSQVGGFIIGTVLRPLVSAFLSWAENIVGAAATAFGWVPGLGDKLNTAKDAIGEFKKNAEKGISDAADTISTKGMEIGKGLVDQGLATVKDPASQNKYKTAGTTLGTSAVKGLESGIKSGQVPVAAAATKVGATTGQALIDALEKKRMAAAAAGDKIGMETAAGLALGVSKGNPKAIAEAQKLVDGVTTTAKDGLGVHSPSTVFMGIGGFVVQGLQQGISNAWSTLSNFWSGKITGLIDGAKSLLGIASPSKVFISMGGNVSEGFGIGLEKVGKVNDKFLDKMQKAIDVSEDKIDRWVTKTKQQLDEAVQAWKDYYDEVFTSITGNVNFADAMRSTQEQAKAVEDAQAELTRAQQNLEKMKQRDAAADAKAAANAAARGETFTPTERDYSSDNDAIAEAQRKLAEAQAAVKSFEDNLNAQIDQSEFFGTMFSKASNAMLEQFGADSPIWATMRQNMLAAGPVEGAALAQYIADNGLSPAMAERLKNWNAWAGDVATDQADKNKGQGVQMAMDAMAGLEKKIKEERKRLVAMGEKMGDGVVVGFKDKESDFKKAVRGYINAAYAELGIHSPSRVFAKIGEYTAEGFNQGVEANLEPFSPSVDIENPRIYAPGLTLGDSISANVSTDVKVFLGDKELTDLVDVQIQHNDARQMDMVIAGRRF